MTAPETRGPVECAWCDRIATGSAQYGEGDWFASCGNHGARYEQTERWAS